MGQGIRMYQQDQQWHELSRMEYNEVAKWTLGWEVGQVLDYLPSGFAFFSSNPNPGFLWELWLNPFSLSSLPFASGRSYRHGIVRALKMPRLCNLFSKLVLFETLLLQKPHLRRLLSSTIIYFPFFITSPLHPWSFDHQSQSWALNHQRSSPSWACKCQPFSWHLLLVMSICDQQQPGTMSIKPQWPSIGIAQRHENVWSILQWICQLRG